MLRLFLALGCALWPAMAGACDTALVLAMDVSNSVDEAEYRLQVDGLADALTDPVVAEAVLSGQVAIAVLQWSDSRQQVVTQPWVQPRGRGPPRDLILFLGRDRQLCGRLPHHDHRVLPLDLRRSGVPAKSPVAHTSH